MKRMVLVVAGMCALVGASAWGAFAARMENQIVIPVQWDYCLFRITAPGGADVTIDMGLIAEQGDLNLYLKYGAPPYPDFDYKSDNYGLHDEQIVLENPMSGVWYLEINARYQGEALFYLDDGDAGVVLEWIGGALDAAFSATSPREGPAPLTVAFSGGASGGDIQSYSWDFGDGSSVEGQAEPTHTYTAPGVYTVTLTVSDGDTDNAEIKTDYVTVTAAAPADGVWKTSDNLAFFLQKYATGSCIVVVYGACPTVFLDADYTDGVDCPDLEGAGYRMRLDLTDASHGTLTADLPEESVNRPAELVFPTAETF